MKSSDDDTSSSEFDSDNDWVNVERYGDDDLVQSDPKNRSESVDVRLRSERDQAIIVSTIKSVSDELISLELVNVHRCSVYTGEEHGFPEYEVYDSLKDAKESFAPIVKVHVSVDLDHLPEVMEKITAAW